MESDEEMIFSPPEEAPSPIRQTTLKRLKKGFASPKSPVTVSVDPDPQVDESPEIDPPVSFHSSIDNDFNEEVLPDDRYALPGRSVGELGEFDGESEPNAACEVPESGDVLGSDVGVEIGFSDTSKEGFGGGEDSGDLGLGENIHDTADELNVSEKNPDEAEKSLPATAAKRKKPKGGKGRKAYLNMIHAESQRLLRETRDVSFEPVPLVQKPISSVLEKIRRRKLEISKRFNVSCDSVKDLDTSADQTLEHEPDTIEHDQMDGNRNFNKGNDFQLQNSLLHDTINAAGGGSDALRSPRPTSDNIHSDDAGASKCQNESQSGTYTAEGYQSENSDTEDNQVEDESFSPQEEENFVPSVLATNLKFESTSPEDGSSEEEDYDKENVDPHPGGIDPAKAFVDDEAEEESDSDNEVIDSEEEKNENDDEEIEDLIAPTYQETAVDSKRRDELHQKWLEQQDAAQTENLFQKYCPRKKKDDSASIGNEEDRQLVDEDHSDESMVDPPPPRGTRKKMRELMQFSLQMFNDDDDMYLSSGDEEEEKRLIHEVHLDKTEDQPSLLSSGADESSREIFGLIKKLNIAPQNKRTTKKTSFFDTLVTGCNSNSSSKSSFLSRSHSISLPSKRKQVSNNSRPYVFSRDDSRSAASTSDISFDTEHDERQPKRSTTAKFSSSQSKSTNCNIRNETGSNSGPSLFELLRMSSMNSSHSIQKGGESIIGKSQIFHQFAAFKFSKKAMKIEGRR